MIDYAKIYLVGIDVKRLKSLECLEFKFEVSEKTGLIATTKIAEYHHCKIIIKENSKDENNPHVYFVGSIHKMWNSLNGIKAPNYKENKPYKGYNGNLFDLNDVIGIRTHLEDLFACKSSQMIFENIEFGVNTTPEFDPNTFLKGLLYHKDRKFEFRYNDYYAQALHNRFLLKIYNKSNQYEMLEKTLRVELKVIKMEELKPLGIKSFADINLNTLEKAKDLILERFDEIVYYDYTIKRDKLSKQNLELLKNYSNYRYWIEDLKSNHRDRHKKKLKDLISKYSRNLHRQIKLEILKKCVMINHQFELNRKNECVIINHSNIPLSITHPHYKNKYLKKTICPITGLDISMQKNNSHFLSHTGLKHYYKTDKKVFDLIKNKHLSELWHNSDFQTQIKEIAHHIRNTDSNQRIKQNRFYKPTQFNLLNLFGI